MEPLDTCPSCGVSLLGEPIPQEHLDQGWYGPPQDGPRHYRRELSVEVRGVYDGGLYWVCPDCDHAWTQWNDGLGRLTELSRRYVDEHNARRADQTASQR